MKCTSNEANKLLKGFQDDLNKILTIEKQSCTYVAAVSENLDEVAPVYDFAETQRRITELQTKIRKVKHAINAFNSTTLIPGFDVTIDEALVLMPQLNANVFKYSQMKCTLPKVRNSSFGSNKTLIEYTYTNYEIESAEHCYDDERAKLLKLQTALDKVNNTVEFEVEF